MNISQLITGIVMIGFGVFLIFVTLEEAFFASIYGLIIIIMGLIILFNTKEDKIEQIKYPRRKK